METPSILIITEKKNTSQSSDHQAEAVSNVIRANGVHVDILALEGAMLNDVPGNLSGYDIVHISDSYHQPEIRGVISAVKQQGAQKVSISLHDEVSKINDLLENTDILFIYERHDFPVESPMVQKWDLTGKVLYQLNSDSDLRVFQGGYGCSISSPGLSPQRNLQQRELFEGTILAHLLDGAHPQMAARYALHAVQNPVNKGELPSIALSPEFLPLDDRVAINHTQVEQVAHVIRMMPEAQPFDYASDRHPSIGHLHAVDYFFATTLQQFGFWVDDGNKYIHPMIAALGGDQLKGSAYMAHAFYRLIDTSPHFYATAYQAQLKRDEFLSVMRSDNGDDPLPAIDLHVAAANHYGQDMLGLGWTPHGILEIANRSENPLDTFIHMLDMVGGYKEDPLRKKSNLLAMILSQRPERFLRRVDGQSILPVVDYHCMRACLRLGLIDILDDNLHNRLVNRELVTPDQEWAVRFSAYQIQKMVEEISGKSIGVVDWFFFNYMRSRCYEMTPPECHRCAADPVCLHRKAYFQPVLRTTHY